MASLNQRIGARLRLVRVEAGFSVEQVASLLGVTETHYRRIENGHHVLTPDKLVKLHIYMGVDPLYLLTGERRHPPVIGDRDKAIVERYREVMEELIDYCRKPSDDIPQDAGDGGQTERDLSDTDNRSEPDEEE